MSEALFQMPSGGLAVDKDGRLTVPFHNYLTGIQRLNARVTEIEARQAAASPDTTGATLSELETSLNALKAALRSANLMKDT